MQRRAPLGRRVAWTVNVRSAWLPVNEQRSCDPPVSKLAPETVMAVAPPVAGPLAGDIVEIIMTSCKPNDRGGENCWPLRLSRSDVCRMASVLGEVHNICSLESLCDALESSWPKLQNLSEPLPCSDMPDRVRRVPPPTGPLLGVAKDSTGGV